MAKRVERVSLTLPHDLVADLDAVVDEREYSSRSKAVRDALRAFLTEHDWEQNAAETQRGSIALVYDHEATGINDRLLEIQHDVAGVIVATQHVHFDAHRCLETVIVEGPGEEIRDLVSTLSSLDGMKHVQFTPV
ncbi:nickel-responsive transcriptional regulator NikR [Natronobiforma cellulositropha]|uniref:nickel-responsive transcriptional regulator NikR n=1 Tax=Natronobiforma cellulositropha TaxID=1679076 RepID=UPI0021D5F07B|nr:nickel-responsive transcriptional regulator NikR [Natronobiforma cellulositropha]